MKMNVIKENTHIHNPQKHKVENISKLSLRNKTSTEERQLESGLSRGKADAAALHKIISFSQQCGFSEGKRQTNIRLTMWKQKEETEETDYETGLCHAVILTKSSIFLMPQCTHRKQKILSQWINAEYHGVSRELAIKMINHGSR